MTEKSATCSVLPPFISSFVAGKTIIPRVPGYADLEDKLSSLIGSKVPVLLSGKQASGKKFFTSHLAESLGFQFCLINIFDLHGDNWEKKLQKLENTLVKATSCFPSIIVVNRIDLLFEDIVHDPEGVLVASFISILIKSLARLAQKSILICTTNDLLKIPNPVLMKFPVSLKLEPLNEEGRKQVIQFLRKDLSLEVSDEFVAKNTAGLSAGELFALFKNLRVHYHKNQSISLSNLMETLKRLHKRISSMLGTGSIPNVSWDDVGGLESVKEEILKSIRLPLEHPEYFQNGIKARSGILLFGPPGTGKTLVAKAVASSCSYNFMSVKGPELLNQYVGQSEANIRDLFEKARNAAPCIIFFDELDSIAPRRGVQGDSGGVMDRIVPQLMVELDGAQSHRGQVFVIAATNRPDLIEPSILRPGRLDKIVYLGVSKNHKSQLKILNAICRSLSMSSTVDLEQVSKYCPFNMTGADFYSLCADAFKKALKRTIEQGNDKVILDQEDFLDALASLSFSISKTELERYEQLALKWSRK